MFGKEERKLFQLIRGRPIPKSKRALVISNYKIPPKLSVLYVTQCTVQPTIATLEMQDRH